MKFIKVFLPFGIFLLIAILLWRGLSLNPAIVPSPLINKKAPDFQLPNLFDSQKLISNQDFLGKVTLLNTWASWCVACAAEHEFLLQLAESQHVRLIGLNYKDNVSDAKNWLQQRGNPYQLVAVDAAGSAAIDWGVYGIPETFVIDKKGVIRFKLIGPLTPDVWEQNLKLLVEKLQSEK